MKKIINKQAYRAYRIKDKLIAGIVLTGAEAKAIRTRGVELRDAFVRIKNGEAFLVNALIHPYPFARLEEQEPSRQRRLLLRKSEIKKLQISLKAKLTVVPLSCYTIGRWIKIKLGIGKRKTKHQRKRDLIKKEIEKKLQSNLNF